jgi:hypothetical protein
MNHKHYDMGANTMKTIRGRAWLLNRWVDAQGPKHVGAIAVSSQPMSTVFFITDGSGVGGDNAELARSLKCVVTGPRSQPAARWARTSGEARLERGEKQRVSRPGRESGSLARLRRHLCLKIVVTEAEKADHSGVR